MHFSNHALHYLNVVYACMQIHQTTNCLHNTYMSASVHNTKCNMKNIQYLLTNTQQLLGKETTNNDQLIINMHFCKLPHVSKHAVCTCNNLFPTCIRTQYRLYYHLNIKTAYYVVKIINIWSHFLLIPYHNSYLSSICLYTAIINYFTLTIPFALDK